MFISPCVVRIIQFFTAMRANLSDYLCVRFSKVLYISFPRERTIESRKRDSSGERKGNFCSEDCLIVAIEDRYSQSQRSTYTLEVVILLSSR